MPEFNYEDLIPIGEDTTEYRLVSTECVSTFSAQGMEFLRVSPEAITNLTSQAIHEISHYLRDEHLQQLAKVRGIDLPDRPGSDNS